MRIYVVLIESVREPGHFETDRAFVTQGLAERWLKQQGAEQIKAEPNDWETPHGVMFRLESAVLYNN